MFNAQRFDYTGLTTTGTQKVIALPDGARSFGLQVKGVGGVPTAWTVLLEGSLDGVNWTTVATHNAADGSTVWAVDKPVTHLRVNVSALTLAPATSLNVDVLAMP